MPTIITLGNGMRRIKKHELERLKVVVQMAEKSTKNPERNVHIAIVKDFILENDPNYDWINSFKQFKSPKI